ncbi:MAG: hypothetical protein ABR518_06130 [Actinomycetota bacterium]
MEEQRQTQGGYGRRWPKWLLIYAVVAGLIYLVVYLVFLRDSGYGGGGGGGGTGGGDGGGGTGGYLVLALPAARMGWQALRSRIGRR